VTADTKRIERLKGLFASTDDPYAGGDIEVARRLSAVLWRVGLVLTWLLLPVSPPTEALGEWGWAFVGAIGLVGLVGARWIASREVTWDFLLVAAYVGVAQLALIQWLSGGTSSPFGELFLLIALPAGAMHPPRRVLGVLGGIALALTLPLVYESAPAAVIGSTVLQFVLLSAIALLGAGLMKHVRAQRLGLRESGARAERLARIDELTGLPNRRAFSEALATEIARARRFGSPLSLIIGDLDDFKGINDTHGHPAGDACLVAMADALRGTLRQYDTCFRWGGDEFALLLPETTAADAEQVVWRLAAAVGGCRDAGGAPLRITCAPAELTGVMSSGDELLAAADEELLARKRARGQRLLRSA
jgi:diguanylate cyclase (GGDEF)-like protein